MKITGRCRDDTAGSTRNTRSRRSREDKHGTRSMPAPLAACLLALTFVLTGLGSPAIAEPAPHEADETARHAEEAGIAARGQAFMGWRNDSSNAPGAGVLSSAEPEAAEQIPGIDVSGWQGNVDWEYWWDQGKRFAYVKATEGTTYRNDYFYQQYVGSYNQGFIRGAYHFATPNTASGAAQANHFVDHGGGWSADGKTLPGVLDIEYNPYGDNCYGMTASQLVNWIRDFASTYKSRTGRDVVIYSARNWWVPCTGDSTALAQTNPLWIADWVNNPPVLFGGWPFRTFWQYTDTPLDQNYFNGSYDRLEALAYG